MDRDEERRIIAQVCAGDTNAFEALVVAYQKQVYNLALRTVGNEEDAADMTQEVFLRAYRALGTFRGESKFSVWLYRLISPRGDWRMPSDASAALWLKEASEINE